jgi:hypothetical protein
MEVCTLSGQDKFGIPIRTITARRSLFPSSRTRSPDSFPLRLPAIVDELSMAEDRAYHVPFVTDPAFLPGLTV